MRFTTKRRTTADDVRRVALAALTAALEDGKQEAKDKPGLTGVRAVATGAVLYTAGRAVFTGRRFVREHVGSEAQEPDDERYDEAEDDAEYDEPEADVEEEEEGDAEYDEPEADVEEEEGDADDDEPEADDRPSLDLPTTRPSRSRAPVGRT
jgi:hypothetical protein